MSTFETGYTGKIIESESVGKNWALIEHEKDIEYLSYEEAMDNVRRFQSETNHPYRPEKPSAKRFPLVRGWHDKVGTELGLSEDDMENGKLKFFTAIDSILDKKHGIDGFMELELTDGQTIQVTLDITTNPQKVSYKAEVMIEIPEDGYDYDDSEDQKKMRELIEFHGEQIVNIFQDKISKIEGEKEKEVAYG